MNSPAWASSYKKTQGDVPDQITMIGGMAKAKPPEMVDETISGSVPNNAPVSVEFTGHGDDGQLQANMPTDVVSTTKGDAMVHEGELLVTFPDGSVRVLRADQVPQEMLVALEKTAPQQDLAPRGKEIDPSTFPITDTIATGTPPPPAMSGEEQMPGFGVGGTYMKGVGENMRGFKCGGQYKMAGHKNGGVYKMPGMEDGEFDETIGGESTKTLANFGETTEEPSTKTLANFEDTSNTPPAGLMESLEGSQYEGLQNEDGDVSNTPPAGLMESLEGSQYEDLQNGPDASSIPEWKRLGYESEAAYNDSITEAKAGYEESLAARTTSTDDDTADYTVEASDVIDDGSRATYNAATKQALQDVRDIANGMSQVDRTIANRYLQDYDASSAANTTRVMSQISADTDMTAGAKNAMIAGLQRNTSSARSDLIGELATSAQTRAEAASSKLWAMGMEGRTYEDQEDWKQYDSMLEAGDFEGAAGMYNKITGNDIDLADLKEARDIELAAARVNYTDLENQLGYDTLNQIHDLIEDDWTYDEIKEKFPDIDAASFKVIKDKYDEEYDMTLESNILTLGNERVAAVTAALEAGITDYDSFMELNGDSFEGLTKPVFDALKAKYNAAKVDPGARVESLFIRGDGLDDILDDEMLKSAVRSALSTTGEPVTDEAVAAEIRGMYQEYLNDPENRDEWTNRVTTSVGNDLMAGTSVDDILNDATIMQNAGGAIGLDPDNVDNHQKIRAYIQTQIDAIQMGSVGTVFNDLVPQIEDYYPEYTDVEGWKDDLQTAIRDAIYPKGDYAAKIVVSADGTSYEIADGSFWPWDNPSTSYEYRGFDNKEDEEGWTYDPAAVVDIPDNYAFTLPDGKTIPLNNLHFQRVWDEMTASEQWDYINEDGSFDTESFADDQGWNKDNPDGVTTVIDIPDDMQTVYDERYESDDLLDFDFPTGEGEGTWADIWDGLSAYAAETANVFGLDGDGNEIPGFAYYDENGDLQSGKVSGEEFRNVYYQLSDQTNGGEPLTFKEFKTRWKNGEGWVVNDEGRVLNFNDDYKADLPEGVEENSWGAFTDDSMEIIRSTEPIKSQNVESLMTEDFFPNENADTKSVMSWDINEINDHIAEYPSSIITDSKDVGIFVNDDGTTKNVTALKTYGGDDYRLLTTVTDWVGNNLGKVVQINGGNYLVMGTGKESAGGDSGNSVGYVQFYDLKNNKIVKYGNPDTKSSNIQGMSFSVDFAF